MQVLKFRLRTEFMVQLRHLPTLQKAQENVAPEASSKKINAGETPKAGCCARCPIWRPALALAIPLMAFALAGPLSSFIVRFLSRVASLQPAMFLSRGA